MWSDTQMLYDTLCVIVGSKYAGRCRIGQHRYQLKLTFPRWIFFHCQDVYIFWFCFEIFPILFSLSLYLSSPCYHALHLPHFVTHTNNLYAILQHPLKTPFPFPCGHPHCLTSISLGKKERLLTEIYIHKRIMNATKDFPFVYILVVFKTFAILFTAQTSCPLILLLFLFFFRLSKKMETFQHFIYWQS